jgi:hypothetical protein
MKTVLLLPPKTMLPELLKELCQQAQGLIARDLGETVHVISARNDALANFDRLGGWAEWTMDVVLRKGPLSGCFVYDAFIVPGWHVGTSEVSVGRATAQIVSMALKSDRPVRLFDSDQGLFQSARQVFQRSTNWISGFVIKTC